MNKIATIVAGGLACLCASTIATTAHATAILSPVAATATSDAGVGYTIDNTIDQSGLSTGFTSGVTDFDTYIAGNPMHSYVALNNEWFTASGTTSASVTYDLGSAWKVDRLALWNEDASGIGFFDVFISLDGVTFTQIANALTPSNNPYEVDYPAEVFALGLNTARYIRLDVGRCPQSDDYYVGCAIGEVAFSAAPANAVPEPGSLPLLLLGLAGLGVVVLRRRRIGV